MGGKATFNLTLWFGRSILPPWALSRTRGRVGLGWDGLSFAAGVLLIALSLPLVPFKTASAGWNIILALLLIVSVASGHKKAPMVAIIVSMFMAIRLVVALASGAMAISVALAVCLFAFTAAAALDLRQQARSGASGSLKAEPQADSADALPAREGKLRLKKVLPLVYCAIALVAWLDFSRLPPDGLANVGLMLVVLPVTLLDLALRPSDAPGSSVLIPDGYGYYADHAMFFGPSVIVIALGLWWLGSYFDGRRAAGRGVS